MIFNLRWNSYYDALPEIPKILKSLSELIYILNLKQINSMQSDSEKDYVKLCAFLKNLPKEAKFLELKLLKISPHKPLPDFCTHFIIKNYEEKVVGIFYDDPSLGDSSAVFRKADNKNYNKKLLEGSEKFLINYLGQLQEFSGCLNRVDSNDNNEKYIEMCLYDIREQLNTNKKSKKVHEKNFDDTVSTTASIAPSTTESTAGLIDKKNYNIFFEKLNALKEKIVNF